MSFVKKFCSHWKYCNVTHDLPDLVFRSVSLFNMNPANVCLSNSTIRTKLQICLQLTIKTLEWRHWHRSGFLTLNFEHFSHLIIVAQLLTLNRQFLAGTLISQTKLPKMESFVPLNFAITKICVAMCLAEDETRMGGI